MAVDTSKQDATRAGALDKRRRKLQTSRSSVESAARALKELDDRLNGNSTEQRKHESALQAALDQVASLKKAIKAAKKQGAKLQTARKRARRDAAKAQQRAATAETKYDRAVLADMLRREKDRDLSAHPSSRTGRTDDVPASRDDGATEKDGANEDGANDEARGSAAARSDGAEPSSGRSEHSAEAAAQDQDGDSAEGTARQDTAVQDPPAQETPARDAAAPTAAARTTATRARSTSARTGRGQARQADDGHAPGSQDGPKDVESAQEGGEKPGERSGS